jgi:hypothetical protein
MIKFKVYLDDCRTTPKDWFRAARAENVFNGLYILPKWNVHSANPVGAKRMIDTLSHLEKK